MQKDIEKLHEYVKKLTGDLDQSNQQLKTARSKLLKRKQNQKREEQSFNFQKQLMLSEKEVMS